MSSISISTGVDAHGNPLKTAQSTASESILRTNYSDDSDSDISMSADTDDDEEVVEQAHTGSKLQLQTTYPSTSSAIPSEAKVSRKRKQSGQFGEVSNHGNGSEPQLAKRLRISDDYQQHYTAEGHLHKDRSLLPAEIWHHIFTFTPPRVLGQLLLVNKSFHTYLDPSLPSNPIAPLSRSSARLLKADTIWQASRKLFRPTIPSPLVGKSELDMWRLACCTSCQFCGKKRQPTHIPQMDQWHPGPGKNGVIPVWSFGIRACGPCLQQKSTKEIDLLLSSSFPTPLLVALPFVYLTNESHLIPYAIIQKGQEPPASIQIKKHFLQQQIDSLQQEFFDVKAKMGTATLEEWLKGLDGRGKQIRNDIARWERFETAGGVSRMRRNELHEAQKFLVENRSTVAPSSSNPALSIPAMNGNSIPALQPANSYYALPQPIQTNLPPVSPMRYDSPSQNNFPSYAPRMNGHSKHERTKDQIMGLKAARRAEIERRCMLLDPPIPPGVLAHMSSFQAAIHIIQPLTDGAWEVLKPRLLSQREEAEQKEKVRIAQTRVAQERIDAAKGVKFEDPRDFVEKEWEDVQGPLRSRLGGYADEIIRDTWNGGNKVNRDNCSAFAVEVLIYVRKRFYAEVAKETAASYAAGLTPKPDPPDGPFTRKATLENMRWLFDTKIKPVTEQYRKELFLCAECDGSFKYYGFEGVIQHYAAKHTTALSLGSVVVHWKSEWPESPPFRMDPSSKGQTQYRTSLPMNEPYHTGQPQTQPYGYGGYSTGPLPQPMQVQQPQNPHSYQDSSATYYGQPQHGDHYSGHPNGPYAPPAQSYMDQPHGYQDMQYSGAPSDGISQGYNQGPLHEYPPQTYPGQYAKPSSNTNQFPHPAQAYPQKMAPGGQQAPYVPPLEPHNQPPVPAPRTSQPIYQETAHIKPTQTPKPFQTEEYKKQLLDVAASAQDVWKTINSVKEVPGSVKVYTVMYHILKRSRDKYQQDPPLSMISDGLNNNKEMRQLRNINGLLCKACSLGMAGSQGQEKKYFSLPQLVNHFRTIHEIGVKEKALGRVPDWTVEMTELPTPAKLSAVARAPGMDDNKLKLFAEALPQIIAKPQLPSEDMHSRQSTPQFDSRNRRQELAPSHDNHEKYYKSKDSSRQQASRPYDQTVVKGNLDGYHQEQPIQRAGSHIDKPPEKPLQTESLLDYRELQRATKKSRNGYHPAGQVMDSRQADAHTYHSSSEDLPTIMARIAEEQKVSASRAASQQNQRRRQGSTIKQETVGGGSEDGEVRVGQLNRPFEDPSKAADQFLEDFHPPSRGQELRTNEVPRRLDEPSRPLRATDQVSRYRYCPEPRYGYMENGRFIAAEPHSGTRMELPGYAVQDRSHNSRHVREYDPQIQYIDTGHIQAAPRERSPELVDRRYVHNNVVFHEDRSENQGTRRTPSRYARYESVRLEQDRARSRSPVYVKVAPKAGQYRERSPPGIPPEIDRHHHQPAAQAHPEDIIYERAPRQEYYRVYADEPRHRQPAPQYAEAYELVRVVHPDGDYMVRRPVRREPEPIYVNQPVYEDEIYGRAPPVYETRRMAPSSRPDSTYYEEEEYDPRYPAPLPSVQPVYPHR